MTQSLPSRRLRQYASILTASGYRPLNPIMAIASGSVVGLGTALRRRLKRRIEIGFVSTGTKDGATTGTASLLRFAAVAKSAVNCAEKLAMKYFLNSHMVLYSKIKVLDSAPNVFSNWLVNRSARPESISAASVTEVMDRAAAVGRGERSDATGRPAANARRICVRSPSTTSIRS